MRKDKRKKGCPNTECQVHKYKIKLNPEDDYCAKCGTKLVFVCEKCFDEIEDTYIDHRICEKCETDAEQKREQQKEMFQEFGVKAASGLGTLVMFGADVLKGDAGELLKKNAGKILKGFSKTK